MKINEISLYTAFAKNTDKEIKQMQEDIKSHFAKKAHIGRSQKNEFKWEVNELILFENGPKFRHNTINMVKGDDRNYGEYKIDETPSTTKL